MHTVVRRWSSDRYVIVGLFTCSQNPGLYVRCGPNETVFWRGLWPRHFVHQTHMIHRLIFMVYESNASVSFLLEVFSMLLCDSLSNSHACQLKEAVMAPKRWNCICRHRTGMQHRLVYYPKIAFKKGFDSWYRREIIWSRSSVPGDICSRLKVHCLRMTCRLINIQMKPHKNS